MIEEEYEYFRSLLLSLREELMHDATTRTAEGGEIDSVAEDMADNMDRSAMESDRNFSLRILDRERKLVKKIDEALERIEKGSFGYCDECGEEIGKGRLEARPVATLCINCKEAEEREEGRP